MEFDDRCLSGLINDNLYESRVLKVCVIQVLIPIIGSFPPVPLCSSGVSGVEGSLSAGHATDLLSETGQRRLSLHR